MEDASWVDITFMAAAIVAIVLGTVAKVVDKYGDRNDENE